MNGIDDGLGRTLARFGAILFFVGLLTGGYAGLARVDVIPLPKPDGAPLALIAHLNAMIGGLWLVAIAATAPHLTLGPRGRGVLRATALLATWSNWAVTMLASILGKRGLELTMLRGKEHFDVGNDVVAILLNVLVVLPALVAAGTWAFGFKKKPPLRATTQPDD